MDNVLVVEDNDSLREVISTVLQCEGYNVSSAATAEEGLSLFEKNEFKIVVSDLKLPNKSGLEFLKETKIINNSVPILVMTAYGSIDIAVQAMKLGATDFITKPFDPEMLCSALNQILSDRRKLRPSSTTPLKRPKKIITQSAKMEQLLSQAQKLAPMSSPVMILGESGTGKELLARYIHENSPRHSKEFIAVNCASTPEDLLESEFFGHEAGAFTGATERRLGVFEAANNGTIFLDEIGEMPLSLQVKLLRTVQESEVKRVGGNQPFKVNVRIISATNCDLQSKIGKSAFRADLYYRLGVVVLEIPPLREREEDIELLTNYFVKSIAQELNTEVPFVSQEAISLLTAYHWPGNIRELENAITRAMIFTDGILTPESFVLSKQLGLGGSSDTLPTIAAKAISTAEAKAIQEVLSQTGGNKSKAAKILGISYRTLLNKFKEYGLETPQ